VTHAGSVTLAPDGDDAKLDARLLAAHAKQDAHALVALYTAAAQRRQAAGDAMGEAFFLTHAWIFALESGDDRADSLKARLATLGRV